MFEVGNELAKKTPEELEEFVNSLVKGVAKRFRQEIMGEWGEESLVRSLREHRSKVARYGWKNAQKWCKWDEDGPVLMPDNTRLYYRKGTTEIVVKEFPPQVRLMKFMGALAKRKDTSETLSEKELMKINHYSLALPYVVFIFKFREGDFVEVKCAFSDRPLKRLEEKPLRPYLSNLDTSLQVCLGRSFDRAKLKKNDIFQQTSYILHDFWQSTYSDEWSTHFWNSRRHFQDKDPRMADLESWQEASIDNPLFVVEDVDWLPHNDDTFGDIIVRMFGDDQTNDSVHKSLYDDLVENFLDNVKETVDNDLKTVEEKIDSNSVSNLIKELL